MWDLVAGASGNISTNTITWEPQPQRRGTFGILTTCFVTLALCTWKIVHLNLPGVCPDADLPWSAWWKPGTTRSMRHRLVHIFGGHQLTRQIGWLLIGLFAPELIAFAAFEQYWDVRSLQKFMEQVYLQKEDENTSWWLPKRWSRSRVSPPNSVDIERDDAEKPVWTMTHSWYAIMGGYSYNLREGGHIYLPDDHGRQRVVLRDEALRFLAEHEPAIIPNLSVATIQDKSSAGTFVKIIALFQALWFSLQCIARMGQGLSISLLELTTFAHCLVALIIGWLWLKKPLDIQEPDSLVIPADAKEPHWLLAMLYTLSSFDGEESDEDRYHKLAPAPSARMATTVADEKETPQIYLQPLGNHDPLSFSQLDLSPGRPESSLRPNSSRPVTAYNANNNNRPGRMASMSPVVTRSSSSPAQSLSELIQAAADAEHRFQLRMQLAQKGWEYYILDAPPPPPLPIPNTSGTTTTTITAATGGDGGGATAIATGSLSPDYNEDPVLVQRHLKSALRNTLVDRVHNFPRVNGSRRPQYYHHHHHNRRLPLPFFQGGASSSSPSPQKTEQQRHTLHTHLGITLAGFLYGGLHLLAWDATFTSVAESVLWKIASISLAASGLLVPVTHAQGVVQDAVRPWLEMDEEDRDAEEEAHLREKAKEMLGGGNSSSSWLWGWWGMSKWDRRKWRRRAWRVYRWCFLWMIEVVRVFRVAVLVLFGLVYFGLRVFVLLECLMNLVHLPDSAFEVVQWSQYVPHIT